MNNNYWSEWLKLKVGVRQGCPLSGLLFDHVISILAHKLKQNTEIASIEIQGVPKLLDMFADDVWNCIKFDLGSFQELMYEYQDFQDFSGLAINYDKTEITRMGSLRKTNARFYSEHPLHWSDGPVKILGIEFYETWDLTSQKNYEVTYAKAKSIIQMWKNRSLTPVGKIQVVNTLINSLFTYKLQVLPSPDAKFLIAYKRMITQFIWNQKKPRISYQRLISSYPSGGQQLRDLGVTARSLKLARVEQLLDPQNNMIWKVAFQQKFQVKIEYLFSCNCSSKDVNKFIEPSIFQEILMIWSEFNFSTPRNVNEVLQQNIWYNSLIRKNNKWLTNKALYENGITKIIDLFDLDTGSFLTFNQFNEDHPGIVDFVTYYSVVSSIPKQWKHILALNNPSEDDDSEVWQVIYNRLICKGKISATMYNFMRDRIALDNSTLLILWNSDLRLNMSQKEFNKNFTNIRKLTLSTKYRYFQYRILVRALTLNIHVSKWDLSVSPRCSFCGSMPETTIHLFIDCPHTKKIWAAMQKWFAYIHDVQLLLTPSQIILNNYRGPLAELINTYILITKFYIYKSRIKKVAPKFNVLNNEVNEVRILEHFIASKSHKITSYEKKWNCQVNLIS